MAKMAVYKGIFNRTTYGAMPYNLKKGVDFLHPRAALSIFGFHRQQKPLELASM